jgi:hypothetical protein
VGHTSDAKEHASCEYSPFASTLPSGLSHRGRGFLSLPVKYYLETGRHSLTERAANIDVCAPRSLSEHLAARAVNSLKASLNYECTLNTGGLPGKVSPHCKPSHSAPCFRYSDHTCADRQASGETINCCLAPGSLIGIHSGLPACRPCMQWVPAPSWWPASFPWAASPSCGPSVGTTPV